jgi:hypothetical protein
MARRRRKATESSLELLLDTICNTFGGVLFLAILIAVLLQMRGRATAVAPADPQARRELIEAGRRHQELAARLEELRSSLAQQDRLMRQFAKPDLAERQNQLEQLQREVEEALADRSRALAELGSRQERVNDTAQAIADLEQRLRTAEKERDRVQSELAQEVKNRTETARLPTLHETSKREHVFGLRHGRLYTLIQDGAPNLNDVELVESGARSGVRLKPDGGQPLPQGDAAKQVYREALRGVAPESTYPALFVWSDSFGEFRAMKSVLIEMRLEYRLVPVTDDIDTLWEGAAHSKVLR